MLDKSKALTLCETVEAIREVPIFKKLREKKDTRY